MENAENTKLKIKDTEQTNRILLIDWETYLDSLHKGEENSDEHLLEADEENAEVGRRKYDFHGHKIVINSSPRLDKLNKMLKKRKHYRNILYLGKISTEWKISTIIQL